ncbi:MAG TPA: cache domain-containing protein, partial [Gemmatimonadales bacterium]|nr:cache domain-containing protein [Gemmatimonadales bacterium]
MAVGVAPLYFYATKVVDTNRERLQRNEKLLQNTLTTTLAQDISQREKDIRGKLSDLAYSIMVTGGRDLSGSRINQPGIQGLLTNSLSSADTTIVMVRLLNPENRFVAMTATGGGAVEQDAFVEKELDRALSAAHENREYSGGALVTGSGKRTRTVMVVSKPILDENRKYLGTLQMVVDLNYLTQKLKEASDRDQGLEAFVVDESGRLVVASPNVQYATGPDISSNELVRSFVEQGANTRLSVTKEYTLQAGKAKVPMLGTYFAVPGLGWAVMAQKTQEDAYIDVIDMQHE